MAAALDQGGLKADTKLKVTKDEPQRVIVEAPDDTDLGKAAAKVAEAQTPHRSKVAPEMKLVLFADLEKDSATKAEKALEKVKGVDTKETKASAEKDEIHIALDGKEKVKLDDLLTALKDAGITARTEKEKDKKKS